MSNVADERLMRFVPGPGEAIEIHAVTWRAASPTVAEVGACPWWWHRAGDGAVVSAPSVIGLGIEADRVVIKAGNMRLLPANWSSEWAPCLPPENCKLSWLVELANGHGDREQGFTKELRVELDEIRSSLAKVKLEVQKR